MQRTRAIRHRESPDLNQTKITPRTRPTHEAGHDGQLIKPDPERKYVLAPKDPQHPMSFEVYISHGYELELAKPDGVRIRLGEPVVMGNPLGWKGNFLLSCSKQRAEEIFLKGPTGLTGQEYYDRLMQKIKRNNLESPVNVPGLQMQHDISELEQNPDPAAQVFRE
jgi:hypothetical protein